MKPNRFFSSASVSLLVGLSLLSCKDGAVFRAKTSQTAHDNAQIGVTNGQVEGEFDGLPWQPEEVNVELLGDNVKSWYSRWYIMSNAQQRIDAAYFNIDGDVFGQAFLGLMLRKVLEGKKVRLILDQRGSTDYTKSQVPLLAGGEDYLQELVEAGAEVGIFNSVSMSLETAFKSAFSDQGFDLKKVIASDHDRMLIVDGTYTITGSRNIARKYLTDVRDDAGAYHDSDVFIKGSGISQLMTQALDAEFNSPVTKRVNADKFGNWSSKREKLLFFAEAMDRWIAGQDIPVDKIDGKTMEEFANQLRSLTKSRDYGAFKPLQEGVPATVKVLDKNAAASGEKNEITDAIIKLINKTEKEIMIQNFSFILTDAAREALQRASDRGVKILVHTNSPNSTDSIFTQAFFLNDWENYLAKMKNMQIWAFTGTRKLHSKVFIFDRSVVTIGTYNMDYMSEQINSEVVACFKSPALAQKVVEVIQSDLNESKQYQIEIQPDGSIKVIYGPMMTIEDHKFKQLILDTLRKANFLRPLI